MKRIAMLTLALCSFAAGQEEKPKPPTTVKVFALKYADPRAVQTSLVNLPGVGATIHLEPKMMVVRAPEEMMPAVEEIIKRLDTPGTPAKNIELTVHLLQASQQPGTGAVPSDLQPVIKQLKSVFNYQDFQVLDTLFLRTREGQESAATGLLAFGDQSNSYQFTFREARIVPDEKNRLIRIDRLRMSAQIPIPGTQRGQYKEIGINADVDVREGQKVVVGKTGIQGSERALILVLSAKVVD